MARRIEVGRRVRVYGGHGGVRARVLEHQVCRDTGLFLGYYVELLEGPHHGLTVGVDGSDVELEPRRRRPD